jgi:hypothetical protein
MAASATLCKQDNSDSCHLWLAALDVQHCVSEIREHVRLMYGYAGKSFPPSVGNLSRDDLDEEGQQHQRPFMYRKDLTFGVQAMGTPFCAAWR